MIFLSKEFPYPCPLCGVSYCGADSRKLNAARREVERVMESNPKIIAMEIFYDSDSCGTIGFIFKRTQRGAVLAGIKKDVDNEDMGYES